MTAEELKTWQEEIRKDPSTYSWLGLYEYYTPDWNPSTIKNVMYELAKKSAKYICVKDVYIDIESQKQHITYWCYDLGTFDEEEYEKIKNPNDVIVDPYNLLT